MGYGDKIFTANDNLPDYAAREAEAKFGRFNPKKTQATTAINLPSELSDTADMISETVVGKGNSLKLSVMLWLIALAFGCSNFMLPTSTEYQSITSLAILWSGLWTSYVAADHNRWRLSEVAIVSTLAGTMGALMIAAKYFSLNLTLTDGTILMSILALIMGFMLKSRMALLASICGSLLWVIISLTGNAPINNLIILFPALSLGQFYCAARIRSGLATVLAIMTGGGGVIGFLALLWANGLMPLTYASSLLFIVGVAHHRSGKAAADSGIPASNIHSLSGWVVAMTSAFIFQYFWLGPDAIAIVTSSMSLGIIAGWKIAVSLSIMIIFISGIIRFKHSQITLPGIFLLTLGSSLIPLMIWFPEWPEALANGIPGADPAPTFGIIIGAGIMAAGLGFAMNGIRQKSLLMVSLGLITLFIEAGLLITPDIVSMDNIIIFFAAFLAALAVGGAIAGNSLAFHPPAPRFNQA